MVGSPLVALPQLTHRAALLMAVAGLSSCGTRVEPPAPVRATPPPLVHANALTADMVGDDEHLWLAVSGRREGAVSLEVLELAARGWRRLPPVSRKVRDGHPIALSRAGAVPCVSYAEAEGARLRCLRRDRWVATSLPRPVRRGASVAALEQLDGRLIALTRAPTGDAAEHRVWRREGDGRWAPLGGAFASRGLVSLGVSADGPALVVQVPAKDGARRIVRRLRARRWIAGNALPRFPYGPQVAGPVVDRGRTFVAVNGAKGARWPFAVVVDGRRGPRLNRGPGHAQGIVGAAGATVWALWQQHRPRSDGAFDARVYAQDIAKPAGRSRLLWSGRSIGPGALAVEEARGAAWALYLRAGRDPDTLQPALARIRSRR